ncbi:MAG: hypothetical protein KF850_40165 [Labilithrix sp.]|nr:hypothetical protein [Labilithrix sp.]MBX3218290.1 hypothetical protein [Labilithrix sp.]
MSLRQLICLVIASCVIGGALLLGSSASGAIVPTPEDQCRDADPYAAASELDKREKAQKEYEKRRAELSAIVDSIDGGDASALGEVSARLAAANAAASDAGGKLAEAEAWIRWYDTCLDVTAAAKADQREDAYGVGGTFAYGRGADERQRFAVGGVFTLQPRPRFRLELGLYVVKEHNVDPAGLGAGIGVVYGRVTGVYLGMDASFVAQEAFFSPRLGVAIRPLWGLREEADKKLHTTGWADLRLFLQPVVSTNDVDAVAVLFGLSVGGGVLVPRQ